MRYLKFESGTVLETGREISMWMVRAECPICRVGHATMFYKKPELKAVLEAKFLPCSTCRKELERGAALEKEQEPALQ